MHHGMQWAWRNRRFSSRCTRSFNENENTRIRRYSTCFCPLRGSPRNRDSATPPTLLTPNPRRPPSNFWPTPWGHHKRAALMPDTDKKFMKRDTVIIQWSSIQIKLRRFLKKRNGTSNNVPLSRASALLKLLQNSLTNNHCLRIESMAHFRQANLSSTGLTFRRTWQNTIDPIWHHMTGYEHAGDGSSSVVHLRWCYAVMRRYRRSDSNCSVDTISWTDIPNSEAAEPDKTSGTPRVPNCKMG